MRYGTEEALRETLARATVLRRKSFQRRQGALAVGTGGCVCALLALGYSLAARSGVALQEADYGAFLLPSRAGVFVLVSVLAFAAGVLVTLLCLRWRNDSEPPGGRSEGRTPAEDRGGGGKCGSPGSRAEQTEHIEETGEGPSERRTL